MTIVVLPPNNVTLHDCARIWTQSTHYRDHGTAAPLSHLPLALQQLQTLLQDAPQVLLLAEHTPSTGIRGFILLSQQTSVSQAHFHYLAVDPEYGNQGIAGKLLGSLATHAVALAWQVIDLEVYIDNDPAIKLYERHHWRPVGNAHLHPKSQRLLQRYQLDLRKK